MWLRGEPAKRCAPPAGKDGGGEKRPWGGPCGAKGFFCWDGTDSELRTTALKEKGAGEKKLHQQKGRKEKKKGEKRRSKIGVIILTIGEKPNRDTHERVFRNSAKKKKRREINSMVCLG